MNKVASLAAVLALVVMGVYFFNGSNPKSNNSDNLTPAGLTSVGSDSAEGKSCCSESGSEMVSTGSCCADKTEMVKTEAGASCCSEKSASCCSEKSEMVKTEAGASCCSDKTAACCSEGKSEVVTTGAEAKACPCQAGKTETVTTGAEKEECHGDCESGCCQEKKAEGEVAKTEGGEGK